MTTDEMTDYARAAVAAMQAMLPYVQHSDSCGDHDAYNGATIQSCAVRR